MVKNCSVLLFVIGLSVGFISCQKLSETKGPLAFEQIKFHDAIPLEYGAFIGVTPDPLTPSWVGLWFEKLDKSIVVVWVNVVEGKLGKTVTTIPRKH